MQIKVKCFFFHVIARVFLCPCVCICIHVFALCVYNFVYFCICLCVHVCICVFVCVYLWLYVRLCVYTSSVIFVGFFKNVILIYDTHTQTCIYIYNNISYNVMYKSIFNHTCRIQIGGVVSETLFTPIEGKNNVESSRTNIIKYVWYNIIIYLIPA